ncbi:hypothetical protein ES705_43747 [subsurface metagenome]
MRFLAAAEKLTIKYSWQKAWISHCMRQECLQAPGEWYHRGQNWGPSDVLITAGFYLIAVYFLKVRTSLQAFSCTAKNIQNKPCDFFHQGEILFFL